MSGRHERAWGYSVVGGTRFRLEGRAGTGAKSGEEVGEERPVGRHDDGSSMDVPEPEKKSGVRPWYNGPLLI